jgi:alpha-ketoglutarate-dependent 2,4-dichlorophenoxyacetate dioxygenase
MTISIQPVAGSFVAHVSDIDIREPLIPEDIARFVDGMDEFAVLILRNQTVSDDQQVAFSTQFGPIEHAVGSNVTPLEDRRTSTAVADVSNLDRDNRVFDREDRRRLFNIGNRLWHSDSSFRPVPARWSLLSARSVVSRGGNTEFADMRAAYEALPDDAKAEIEDLVCEHSLMHSRGLLGFTEFNEVERAAFKPVRQRLVRTHPGTGAKSLYLSSHAGGIEGWPMPEARAFLRDLNEHATQPQFVHVHHWQLHDLVVWDNQQTMHRVRRFNEQNEPRDMRRTTLKGAVPTISQAG